MIASQFRLSGQDNFDRVLRKGNIVQATPFGLVYLDRGSGGVSKYGFVVSAKVSKEAVQRNRIKRALSEATRFLTGDVKEGYDVVFLAKQTATRMPTDEIMREVREGLIKAGLIK